jgi:hypothetical protein
VRKRKYNPKRRIDATAGSSRLALLASKVVYVGSGFHKRNPGDLGLVIPPQPRPNKTLCDAVHISERSVAQQLLENGVKFSLISVQCRGELPQNIWAVAPGDIALEAQLDNVERATYHGYPMLGGDPLAQEVLRRWKEQLSHE